MPRSELAEYVSKACFGVHTRDLYFFKGVDKIDKIEQ
jgi:hypothetical protein